MKVSEVIWGRWIIHKTENEIYMPKGLFAGGITVMHVRPKNKPSPIFRWKYTPSFRLVCHWTRVRIDKAG